VEEDKSSRLNSHQEMVESTLNESTLKQCQDFVTELTECSEAWPFQKPVSRKEVCLYIISATTRRNCCRCKQFWLLLHISP